MGAILLMAALVGAYIICYWSVMIEISGDKTLGLLGLKKSAGENLHELRQTRNYYSNISQKEREIQSIPLKPAPKRPYLR